VFVELDAEPNIALETSEREMLMQFVAAGLGVALIPEGFARARPSKGLRIHELDPPVRRTIGAVVPAADPTELVDQFLVTLEAGTDLTRTRPAAPRRRTRPRAR